MIMDLMEEESRIGYTVMVTVLPTRVRKRQEERRQHIITIT